ncbi:MAG: LLM class flavin-dependent oxidoreductase [Candidatus Limnocylindria bacterium]
MRRNDERCDLAAPAGKRIWRPVPTCPAVTHKWVVGKMRSLPCRCWLERTTIERTGRGLPTRAASVLRARYRPSGRGLGVASRLTCRCGADLHAIFGDPHQPTFEGYATLAAWAKVTARVKLGLLVGANTFRNPGLVAKSVATIDHLSGGRAVLGIGGAWFELEHVEHGIEFGASPGQRLT